MKKFVSVLLTCILTFSLTMPCYAEKQQDNVDGSLIDLMVSDAGTTVLTEQELQKGIKTYTIKTTGVLANVQEEEVEDGVLYTFVEGNLKNELLVTPEYDMYLDGNLVTVKVETENENAGVISPRAYYEYWKVSDSPFASGSYTTGKSTQKISLSLNEAFRDIAYSTLVGMVIGAAVGMVYGGSVGATAGTVTGAISAGGLAIYREYMRRNNPEQSVAYLRRTFTTNGKPNTTSSPLEYYYKILVEYSYDYNFKTSSITSTDTFYGIQYIANH
ncbi:hypothetical protein [Anaerotignum propionicum]|uniref:hypothetical protein n=1 Tax=Anaerotignum propionicum TaxID=28446 RepID=UPI0028A2AC7C|nr:hypothetical protein [Anaerotignum propionicum]